MTVLDLRPPPFDIFLPAGDFFPDLEVTVDDPVLVAGEWTAQIRSEASADDVHAAFTITPNGAGTGVVLSLDSATTRSLHTSYARLVRDPELGLVYRYVGVYDVQTEPVVGEPATLLAGTITLDQDVTR